MDPHILELTKALAWHMQLQTYLLIGLVPITVAAFWSIMRDMRALGRLANAAIARRQGPEA